ncbi:HD2 homeodomain mating-type protein [Pyrrhoderma noxium]|uniref:HD2 homeodomain mating-type protein n=1 Tax=Pyrrhoderma noxium TaxID=2282107 RepID=A0A286USL2_9AGAM|nr:HD2 homeodomain mating-type protein [Pyrrhoderma noxium]
MVMSSKNPTEPYSSILQTAKRIQQSTSTSHSYWYKMTTEDSTYVLDLPEPRSISQELIDLGLEGKTAQKLSQALSNSARELSKSCQLQYQTACSKLVRSTDKGVSFTSTQLQEQLRNTCVTVYNKRVNGWAFDIINSTKARLIKRSDNGVNLNSVKPFNNIFELNSRPTRTQKNVLAQRTGMSTRQINVWFQNRRSRSKKSSIMDLSAKSQSLPQITTEKYEPIKEFTMGNTRDSKNIRFQCHTPDIHRSICKPSTEMETSSIDIARNVSTSFKARHQICQSVPVKTVKKLGKSIPKTYSNKARRRKATAPYSNFQRGEERQPRTMSDSKTFPMIPNTLNLPTTEPAPPLINQSFEWTFERGSNTALSPVYSYNRGTLYSDNPPVVISFSLPEDSTSRNLNSCYTPSLAKDRCSNNLPIAPSSLYDSTKDISSCFSEYQGMPTFPCIGESLEFLANGSFHPSSLPPPVLSF